MRKGVMILMLFVIVVPLYGFNSLVRQEDIPKMRELGISQEVIQYFIANQTSSLSSEDVIKMKQSGSSNKDIMSAIQSDLYRPEKKSTSMKEAELVAKLKAAGMSDEAVLQFLQTVKSTRRVDSDGFVSKHYANESQRTPYPTTGATFPKPENYGYDPINGRYYFFVNPQNNP
jgi:DNA-binding transcriptional regulator YhcF (GntR family)